MSKSVSIIWNEALASYNFNDNHPFNAVRQILAMRLADEFGLLDHSNVTVVSDFGPASDDQLLTVHTAALLAGVRRAGADPDGFVDAALGIEPPDNPAFEDMHTAAARVVGATLAAAREIDSGRAEHAVNISGGLHHAMPDKVSGFCVYNDIGVAIKYLLAQGWERIAYLDVDVHHGDGVQKIFWDEPRVLTVSIHESPDTLFPGTGYPTEVGGPGALGSAVNIAVPAGTGDQGWLRAFHAVTPHLLKEFKPQIIVSQHGCDSHFEDPLANLVVSLDGQRMAAEGIHRWAHRYAQGRWLAVGGGGYEWVDVVPRSWAHLLATAIGKPIKPRTELPLAFHEYVLEVLGRRTGHTTMTDGYDPWPKNWEMGYDPADPLDAAVVATRKAVFPVHGIMLDRWQGF